MIVRDALQARYGSAAVTVESRAVGHMTAENLIEGNDGVNKPWPQGVPTGAWSLVNFGINDSVRWPIEQYKANLRILHPTYFETPNPTDSPIRPYESTQAFAEAMRDVAAELHVPVIDVNAFVLAMPDWRAHLADGIHPDDQLYAAIGGYVLQQLEPDVAKARCQ